MRVCKTCNLEKSIDDFHSMVKAGKRYWAHVCKECKKPLARARKKAWYLKNPDHAKKYSREWFENNKERAVRSNIINRRRPDRIERYREMARLRAKRNPGPIRANKIRYLTKQLQATPAWSESGDIKELYKLAAQMRAAGTSIEVDHIVPLRSPLVCGLHVRANLQLIEPLANNLKGNRWWPDMAA